MSEQLAVRVIGTPQTTTQAVLRLPALFEVDHQHSPCPSRKTPGRVRYYLTARLRPGWIDQAPLAQIEDRKAARDPRGHAPDCPAALRGRPPYGATFLAVAWPRSGSEVRFRVVSRPRPTTPRRGAATRSRTCGLRGRRSRWCAPARSFCHRAGGGGGVRP